MNQTMNIKYPRNNYSKLVCHIKSQQELTQMSAPFLINYLVQLQTRKAALEFHTTPALPNVAGTILPKIRECGPQLILVCKLMCAEND